ncbi:MAG: DUF362 domain-containing protein, partial [Candidatus Hodarchaeota archaeon]
MDSVALVKPAMDIERALERGLELIGGFQGLKSPVLVKPNICTISDGTGSSVTDVRVVEALVRLVLKEDPSLDVQIIESDSQSKYAMDAFEKFGYKKLADKMQESGFSVSVVDLSSLPLEQIDFDGAYFKDPELPEVLTRPNYFISVAVSKTHYLT